MTSQRKVKEWCEEIIEIYSYKDNFYPSDVEEVLWRLARISAEVIKRADRKEGKKA